MEIGLRWKIHDSELTQIVCSKLNARILVEQPVRKSSHITFGTNVGSWSKNHVQVLLCSEFDELLKIRDTSEIIDVFLRVVKRPLNISGHSCQPCRSHRSQLSLPCLRKRTKIMKASGYKLERFSVHPESIVVVVDIKSARRNLEKKKEIQLIGSLAFDSLTSLSITNVC
jgi:hypothetical protein